MKNTLSIFTILLSLLVCSTACRKRVYCNQCSFSSPQDSVSYAPKECFDNETDAEAYIQQLSDSAAAQGSVANCMLVIPK